MLCDDDLALVRRDPALAGLGVILDGDALGEILRRHLPDTPISTIHPTYVRYKRGRSCIVGFELKSGEVTLDGYAKAFPQGGGKLEKFHDLKHYASALGPGCIVLNDLATGVCFFPVDVELHRPLRRLAHPDYRARLMRKRMGERAAPWGESVLRRLAYKPERRYVAQILLGDQPRAVVRVYSDEAYQAAARVAGAIRPGTHLRVQRFLGASPHRNLLVYAWEPGRMMSGAEGGDKGDEGGEAVEEIGVALGELHQQPPPAGIPRHDLTWTAVDLLEACGAISALCPEFSAAGRELSRQLTEALPPADDQRLIHGDFHPKQILRAAGARGPCVLDFDEAAEGDPAADIGNFLAHLRYDTLLHGMTREAADRAGESLLAGYRSIAPLPDERRVRFHTACSLLKLASKPFRRRDLHWAEPVRRIVADVSELASRLLPRPLRKRSDVSVQDDFTAAADPAIPWLSVALNPDAAHGFLAPLLISVTSAIVAPRLRAIRVTRHKPGQRSLIEYDVQPAGTSPFTVIAKVSAKKLDDTGHRALVHLRGLDFGPNCTDGICVPQPVGVVPRLHMTMYRKVEGISATELLAGASGGQLAARIAEAAHKLHRVNLPLQRVHDIADELQILRERLIAVAQRHPAWRARIERILRACENLAATIPPCPPTTIHRDFYPDQVIVSGGRLFLVDFDLCCRGDPALDIGNFIAHITEYSLRRFGRPDALIDRERAAEHQYVELSGVAPATVRAYSTLTLVRHIFISTRIADRQFFTEPLIDLCEKRLACG